MIVDNRVSFKIVLPDSPHPMIISKNRFRALHLAGRNEFRFFEYKNTGFCPKN